MIILKKLGLFLNGELIIEYPVEAFHQAIDDCKFATEETGVIHELKIID